MDNWDASEQIQERQTKGGQEMSGRACALGAQQCSDAWGGGLWEELFP